MGPAGKVGSPEPVQRRLAVPGAVFVDADEASNRVRIGVEPGAGGRVRAALAKLRMPDAAVIVEERAPVTYAVAQGPKPKAKPGSGPSLQGTVRPIIGGVQINFPGFLCTLGFQRGAAASSPTPTAPPPKAAPRAARYWQPTQSASPTQVATEAADPQYLQQPPGLPLGPRLSPQRRVSGGIRQRIQPVRNRPDRPDESPWSLH